MSSLVKLELSWSVSVKVVGSFMQRRMLRDFYPYEFVEDVFSIDYQRLYENGVRGIIFDVDNTLVPHGLNSTKAVDELFRKIHGLGFKTLLMSNNCEARILRFKANIDTLYIHRAGKPNPDSYWNALSMMGLKKEETVVVGDQIFTDILGANRAGIPNILVRYIGYRINEETGWNRKGEKLLLFFYSLRKKYQHRLGLG